MGELSTNGSSLVGLLRARPKNLIYSEPDESNGIMIRQMCACTAQCMHACSSSDAHTGHPVINALQGTFLFVY
jgi:hypothetical protein